MSEAKSNISLDYQIILTIKLKTKSASLLLRDARMEADLQVDLVLRVMLPWRCAVLQLKLLDLLCPPWLVFHAQPQRREGFFKDSSSSFSWFR